MLSRQLLSEAEVPAPFKGYRMVRFRTNFENKRGTTKTVSDVLPVFSSKLSESFPAL